MFRIDIYVEQVAYSQAFKINIMNFKALQYQSNLEIHKIN